MYGSIDAVVFKDRSMTSPTVKYQIVVRHVEGTEMILGKYVTLEDARKQLKQSEEAVRLGFGSMIARDPDWNHFELQRVEVIEA
jgi:hypothetical protein